MSAPKKRRLAKRKGKIKISTSAQLVHKNDKTRVARRDTIGATQLKKAPFIINDNGLNMRIKIKRKSR